MVEAGSLRQPVAEGFPGFNARGTRCAIILLGLSGRDFLVTVFHDLFIVCIKETEPCALLKRIYRAAVCGLLECDLHGRLVRSVGIHVRNLLLVAAI